MDKAGNVFSWKEKYVSDALSVFYYKGGYPPILPDKIGPEKKREIKWIFNLPSFKVSTRCL